MDMGAYSTTILIGFAAVFIAAFASYFGAKHGYRAASRKRRSQRYNHVALDKRLEVHQQAFSLSLQLPTAAEDPDKHANVLHECDKFWKSNCLFMLPKVRESFRVAYQTAWIFPTYKDQFSRKKINEKELGEVWKKITNCTYDIVQAIGLRWLGDLEPIAKEGSYQRRASDWEDKELDRRSNGNGNGERRLTMFK